MARNNSRGPLAFLFGLFRRNNTDYNEARKGTDRDSVSAGSRTSVGKEKQAKVMAEGKHVESVSSDHTPAQLLKAQKSDRNKDSSTSQTVIGNTAGIVYEEKAAVSSENAFLISGSDSVEAAGGGFTDNIDDEAAENTPDDDFYEAGRLYLERKCESDITKAIDLFKRSSRAGDARASYALYRILYRDSTDRGTAIAYLQRAAGGKYVPAMYDLAIHYLYGDDTQKNVENAVQLMEECAEAGHKDAVQKLYYIFKVGFEVKQDMGKADKYKKMLGTI